MLQTPLCELIGIQLPIIQAPIGSATSPVLAAAVSNAGGHSDFISLPGMTGDLEALALYAGQSAGLISRIQPAKEIITDLVNEAKQAVQHLKTIC